MVSSIVCKGLHQSSPNFSCWLWGGQGMPQDGTHTHPGRIWGRMGRKRFLPLLAMDCTNQAEIFCGDSGGAWACSMMATPHPAGLGPNRPKTLSFNARYGLHRSSRNLLWWLWGCLGMPHDSHTSPGRIWAEPAESEEMGKTGLELPNWATFPVMVLICHTIVKMSCRILMTRVRYAVSKIFLTLLLKKIICPQTLYTIHWSVFITRNLHFFTYVLVLHAVNCALQDIGDLIVEIKHVFNLCTIIYGYFYTTNCAYQRWFLFLKVHIFLGQPQMTNNMEEV